MNTVYICLTCLYQYDYRPEVCEGCGSDRYGFFEEPTEGMFDHLNTNPAGGNKQLERYLLTALIILLTTFVSIAISMVR